jgi:hypothetical protein
LLAYILGRGSHLFTPLDPDIFELMWDLSLA